MMWLSRLLLFSLSIVITVGACAQSTPPLPDVNTLIQQTILQQRIAESKEQDYVFREDFNANRLNKKCTWAPQCPETAGVAYTVLAYTERKFEVFWLDGTRVARVVPNCDYCGRGLYHNTIREIPVSAGELAAENKRVDNEVAEARALIAQGRKPTSPDDPPQILFSRMLELGSFSNPRRQIIRGRPTVLLDFSCNPQIKTVSINEALLTSFAGTIGIDEEDHAVEHAQGKYLADVKTAGGAVNIRKGTRVTIENTRVDKGIWLLSRLFARGEAHYFAFSMDGDVHIFAGDYRKFHVTVRVLPASSQMLSTSPASTASKTARSPIVPH